MALDLNGIRYSGGGTVHSERMAMTDQEQRAGHLGEMRPDIAERKDHPRFAREIASLALQLWPRHDVRSDSLHVGVPASDGAASHAETTELLPSDRSGSPVGLAAAEQRPSSLGAPEEDEQTSQGARRRIDEDDNSISVLLPLISPSDVYFEDEDSNEFGISAPPQLFPPYFLFKLSPGGTAQREPDVSAKEQGRSNHSLVQAVQPGRTDSGRPEQIEHRPLSGRPATTSRVSSEHDVNWHSPGTGVAGQPVTRLMVAPAPSPAGMTEHTTRAGTKPVDDRPLGNHVAPGKDVTRIGQTGEKRPAPALSYEPVQAVLPAMPAAKPLRVSTHAWPALPHNNCTDYSGVLRRTASAFGDQATPDKSVAALATRLGRGAQPNVPTVAADDHARRQSPSKPLRPTAASVKSIGHRISAQLTQALRTWSAATLVSENPSRPALPPQRPTTVDRAPSGEAIAAQTATHRNEDTPRAADAHSFPVAERNARAVADGNPDLRDITVFRHDRITGQTTVAFNDREEHEVDAAAPPASWQDVGMATVARVDPYSPAYEVLVGAGDRVVSTTPRHPARTHSDSNATAAASEPESARPQTIIYRFRGLGTDASVTLSTDARDPNAWVVAAPSTETVFRHLKADTPGSRPSYLRLDATHAVGARAPQTEQTALLPDTAVDRVALAGVSTIPEIPVRQGEHQAEWQAARVCESALERLAELPMAPSGETGGEGRATEQHAGHSGARGRHRTDREDEFA